MDQMWPLHGPVSIGPKTPAFPSFTTLLTLLTSLHFCFLLSAFFQHSTNPSIQRPEARCVCCWRDVISMRRRAKSDQTAGRCFFTSEQGNISPDAFPEHGEIQLSARRRLREGH